MKLRKNAICRKRTATVAKAKAIFYRAYAALKGRSSTVTHAFVTLSAGFEGVNALETN
jgi:hypothetical protein